MCVFVVGRMHLKPSSFLLKIICSRQALASLALICLLAVISGRAVGQTVSPRQVFGRYQQLVWQDRDGLPENTIMAVTQTRDGYLWVATVEGVARFDGVRFTVFDINNTPAIKNNHVLSLLEDRHGNLWMGTNGGGLTCYRDGRFSHYGAAEGLSEGPIYSLLEDRAGNLWVGTRGGGLNLFRDGKFTVWDTRKGLPDNKVWAMAVDKENALWISTSQGLTRFKNERFTTWTAKEGVPRNLVRALMVDREGTLWLGTNGGLLAQFREGRFTIYNKELGLAGYDIRSILQDQEGAVWIATMGGGLVRFWQGRFEGYKAADGLPSDRVLSLYQSREGDLWAGTNGFGLSQIRSGRVSLLTEEKGLINDFVRPVLEDAAGALWVGTVAGLSRYKDGSFTNWTTKDGLPNNHVVSLHEDAARNLWVGTTGGLARFKDGRFTAMTTGDGRLESSIRAIATDRAGNLWVGTDGGGLLCFRDGRMTTLNTSHGLSNNIVSALLVDRADQLWIGTWGGGLNRYVNGKFTSWTAKDGLVSNQLYALCETADGALWIGTGSGGLSRFKQGRFANVTMKNGLYDNLTYNLMTDDNGDLWMNSNRGLFRTSLAELNDFCDGRRASVSSYSYGTADGILNRESCMGHPAGWKTRDGRLLFPTLKGVVIIEPRNGQQQAPLVNIESVKLAGTAIPISSANLPLTILPGQSELEIEYTGLYWSGPQHIGFKYQMAGLKQGWIDAGTRRTAYYPYLPPGEYDFRVIANNGDGVWNQQGRSLRIIVMPPFYRTWWFSALLALALIGIVGLVFKWRLNLANRARRIQEDFSKRLIESQESERKRIAGELHDGLGQSLVIIKNRALHSLTEPGDHDRAIEQIEEIADAATHAILEAREIAYNLRPFHIDRLGLTSAIGAMIKRAGNPGLHFATELDSIDGLLAPEQEINFYRVVQECLNNILKHSAASEASVTIKRNDHMIELTIRDNGRGFTPGLQKESSNGSGFGLLGLTERARILGGVLTITSAPGEGTVTNLKLPVPRP